MATPKEFLQYIDDKNNQKRFVQRLADAVAIPSVSGEAAHRPDVLHMTDWLNAQLNSLGVTTKLMDVGTEEIDGQILPLPKVIFGRIGEDKNKKTILVYGHYDVQPAQKSDGWNTEPFVLTPDDTGRLFGRGSTDDKGPVLGWLNVLEAHKALGRELPVNMRFCFEGMEESGSNGLDKLIESEAAKGQEGWFAGVDAMCISDNYWLNARTPCITYGLRGLVYFQMTVSGPAQDLHSGVFGRMVHEPMTDLSILMSKLVAPDGTILVDDVEALVPAATEDEKDLYRKLDFKMKDLDDAVGASIALSDDPANVLMGRMRMPSLSIHGVQGAFSGEGSKTVIPARVTAKFSIRIVTPQTVVKVEELVKAYLKREFAKIGTKNTLTVEKTDGGEAWTANYEHWNYQAAIRATYEVYGVIPDLTREGGSIPVTLTFANSLGINVLLLPMGRGDDGAHSTNEKIDSDNFFKASKLLGTYLYEVAGASANAA
ncbi:Zn-dependent exopeptidase [Trametes cingulata]|nr:Zn-dependent exopeptidase [Trametes cingulata]